MITPSLRIKYIYLSFLQTYFSAHTKYTWNIDPSKTKIAITDKYSTDFGKAATKPSIVIDRGNIGLTDRFRAEAIANNNSKEYGIEFPLSPRMGANKMNNYNITQTWATQVRIRIMAKRPYMVDEIANEVFLQIWAYREWFKEKGIHTTKGLSMSNERIIKISPADLEVSNVDIGFAIERQETIRLGERLYNLRLYNGDVELYEGIDFQVEPTGIQIQLLRDPGEQLSLTMDYVDAITLEENANIDLITVNGSNRLYTVPNNGKIYGYYKIFQNLIIKDGDTEIINED